MTGVRPIDVTADNAKDLWDKIFRKHVEAVGKDPKYVKEDEVRISKAKPIFEKGYMPTFTDEIFRIDTVSRSNPNFYLLRDYKNEPIGGRLYTEELCKTRLDEDTTYRIEKVLRKRTRDGTKELYVKFKGYPNPQWIKESNVV